MHLENRLSQNAQKLPQNAQKQTYPPPEFLRPVGSKPAELERGGVGGGVCIFLLLKKLLTPPPAPLSTPPRPSATPPLKGAGIGRGERAPLFADDLYFLKWIQFL